jgi:hypothetical protein
MSIAELKLIIHNRIEHLDEQQLKQVIEFLKDIDNLLEIDPLVLSNAMQIMNEREKVLEKLAQ